MSATPLQGRLSHSSNANPCPVCQGTRRCSRTADGLIFCKRQQGHVLGFKLIKIDSTGEWGLYRECDDYGRTVQYEVVPRPAPKEGSETPSPGPKYTGPSFTERLVAAQTHPKRDAALRYFAPLLGISYQSLIDLGVGYARDYRGHELIFPMRDANLDVCGAQSRYFDGNKPGKASFSKETGSKVGIFAHARLQLGGGPAFVTEGGSDVGALLTMGIVESIGRYNVFTNGDVERIAAVLCCASGPAEQPVIVTGENDQKEDGTWPGRDLGRKFAKALANRARRNIYFALTPDGEKDIRSWLMSAHLDPEDEEECRNLGRILIEKMLASAEVIEPDQLRDSSESISAESSSCDQEPTLSTEYEKQKRREACHHPGRKMLDGIHSDKANKGILLPCRDCLGCWTRQERLKKEELEAEIAGWKCWLTKDISETEWEATKEFVRYYGGEWHRVPLPGGMIRVSMNVPLAAKRGFCNVSRDELVASVGQAIAVHVRSGDERNITSSNDRFVFRDANGEQCDRDHAAEQLLATGRLFRDSCGKKCKPSEATEFSSDIGETWYPVSWEQMEPIHEPRWRDAGKFRPDWRDYLKKTLAKEPGAVWGEENRDDGNVTHLWYAQLPETWSDTQVQEWKEGMKNSCQFEHGAMGPMPKLAGNRTTEDGLETFDDELRPCEPPKRQRRAG
jgi:hypothetical protein